MAILAVATLGAPPGKKPPELVASFSVLADLTQQVAGVGVPALVPPGSDAHAYEPRPADIRRLRRAGVFVVNGLGFEGWMDRLVESSGFDGVRIVASQGVDPLPGGEGLGPDPHAWHSVPRAMRYVENIAAGLAQAHPADSAGYRRRATVLLDSLRALDVWIRRAVAGLHPGERRVMASHGAFGYYAAEYGLDIRAPVGWGHFQETSAGEVAALIGELRHWGARVVFLEYRANPRLMDQIAREAGVRVGGTLYSDGLSEAGGPAATYLDMMRHNTRQITGMPGP